MAKRQKKSKPDNRLNYGEVSRELKSGGPARLYLLYGREDYLREAFLGELKALCLPEGEDDFSYHRLDGKNLDMRELSDAVNALPFLTERTLTEVRGYDFARCRDAEAASLERLISDIPDCCTLVFVQDTDFEPDQRTKIIKAVAKYGKLIDFTSQGQGPLVQWIRKRFAALGKNATPDACLTLIYLSGELMNGLIPEIEKIAAGTAGELVTAEDVSRLALRIPEARVFEMTDYLAARDYDGAARTLADLMSMARSPSPSWPSSACRCGGSTPHAWPWTRSWAAISCEKTAESSSTSCSTGSCAPRAASTCARWSAQSASVPKRTMP